MNIDKLHYISQAPEKGSHLKAIEQVLAAGVKWVQLRVKEQAEGEVLAMAIAANALCKSYGAKLIVNDFPEIALKADAWGVHLGLDDMPVTEARALLGKDKCIGGTANKFADILRRVEEGADYIGLGPFQFTTTKKNLSPLLGLEGYEKLMQQVRDAQIEIPVIAIGGINLTHVPAILKTGVHGIAVSSVLTKDPEAYKFIRTVLNAN